MKEAHCREIIFNITPFRFIGIKTGIRIKKTLHQLIFKASHKNPQLRYENEKPRYRGHFAPLLNYVLQERNKRQLPPQAPPQGRRHSGGRYRSQRTSLCEYDQKQYTSLCAPETSKRT